MFQVIENTYDASKSEGKGPIVPSQKVMRSFPSKGKAQTYADKLNEAQSLRELSCIKTYYVRNALTTQLSVG